MSWKDSSAKLWKKYGPACKVVAGVVLNVVAPGSGALVGLADKVFNTADDLAQGHWEAELMRASQQNADELAKLGSYFELLTGDLAKLSDEVFESRFQPDKLEAIVRNALASEGLADGLRKLDALVNDFAHVKKQLGRLIAGHAEMLPILRRLNSVLPFLEECQQMGATPDKVQEALLLRQMFLLGINNRQPEQARSAVKMIEAHARHGDTHLYKAGIALVERDMPGVRDELGEVVRRNPQDKELVALHRRATVIATGMTPRTPQAPRLDAAPLFQLGELLDGWRLQAHLGAGGWGQVFKAVKGDRTVALKVMHPRYSADNALVTRFRGEFHALMRLPRHDNLPQIVEFKYSAERACWYLAMEYIDGPTLENYLDGKGALTVGQIKKVFGAVTHALGQAHAVGILHRDIKPSNFVFRKADQKLVLIDFGLAVQKENVGKTTIGGMTLMFAAPEQARGLPADARSDVFSLAATIYYALLHDKPDLRDPAYFDPDAVPEALRAVLAKAMATNPRHRYADGAEFHAALLAAAAPAESAPFAAPTLPVVLPVARPAAARSPIRKAQQGRPFAVVLSCLGATVALAVVVILIGLGAFNSGVPKKVAQTDKVLNQDAAPKKLISKSPAKSKTPKPGDTISNKLGMKFAWIPPGTFTMGSPPSEQEQAIKDGAPAYRVKGETQHRVTLTKGFYMGVHQVTQAQWRDIMTENPNPSHFKGDSLPVEQVSWFDAVNFCNALSAKEGAKPYYKIDGVKVTILGGTGFRLPTEAEWEYACRAGTKTPFYFGDTISTDQANYAGDYVYGKGKKGVNRQKTTPVGSLPYPNAWGLYDMHGNVWEWCADWYAVYPDGEQVDPQGPTTGDGRVLRGGSFYGNPWFARSANRGRGGPANLLRGIGLRVARTL